MSALLETIALEFSKDKLYCFDLDSHLARLSKSASELNFNTQGIHTITQTLETVLEKQFTNDLNHKQYNFESYQGELYKLRLLYKANGEYHFDIEKYQRDLNQTWHIYLLGQDEFNVDINDWQYKHKLWPRPYNLSNYIESYAVDEIIWLNNLGNLAEGSFTNLFLQDTDGNWLTPSLEGNILQGIMREKIITQYQVKESKLKPEDLFNASKIYLSNSLIGLKQVHLKTRI